MAYPDRDWDNTGTKVTKKDFKRIEKGIKANDTAITEQAKQINVLESSPNFTGAPTIKGQEIATTKVTQIDFPFNSGFETAQAVSKVFITGSMVTVSISVKKSDGSDFTNTQEVIGILPSGYLPTKEHPTSSQGGGTSYTAFTPCYAYVGTNGRVVVANASNAASVKVINFNICFPKLLILFYKIFYGLYLWQNINLFIIFRLCFFPF